jgi:BioD-like phosphotransacetylase family protein
MKVFGVDVDSLGDKIEQLKKVLQRPSLAALGMPDVKKLEMLQALERADARLDSLEKEAGDTAQNEASRVARERAIDAARNARAEVIHELDIPDIEAENIIRDLRSLKSSIEAKDADPTTRPENNDHE